MALISKIREKTIIVVGFVALGLILFIGTDLFLSNNSPFSGGRNNDVGEIAGTTVSVTQYQQAIEEMKYNWTLNTGRAPTEREMNSLRQQAWDKLIAEIAFQKQYDALGLTISNEEIIDMVQGNNISPELRQAFTNPETGEFNREQVINYLQNLKTMPQQQQLAWYNFESNLGPSRLRLKYDNLLVMSNYITTAEAKDKYKEENTIAEVKYLYVPFYAISDSAVNVTDAQLQSYLDNHQEDYKVEEGVNVNYVAFPVIPSEQDTAMIQEDIAKVKNNFKTANNDSTFASLNTDSGTPFGSYKINEIPATLTNNAGNNLTEGEVYGPYLEGNVYTLFKVSEITEDTVNWAKASHILIKTSDDVSDAEARKKARGLLDEIKNGGNFETIAQQNSDDPSSAQGGDLGWFSEGRMVEPFENAVFSRNEPGLVNKLVKTEYGYHIIKVTEAKTNTLYRIAAINREIYPSDNTRNQAFRKADLFAGSVSNAEQFNKQAQADSLSILSAIDVAPNATFINGIDGNARPIIRWAYTEASIGDISQVFEMENSYVIALLTGRQEKGTASLDNVREEIAEKVKAQEKGKIIAEKLRGISGTLDERAANYGEDASVYNTSDLKITSNALTGIGFDPKAVGKVFSLKEGEISEPFIGENGVLVFELEALTPAPEIADYSSYRTQLQQQRQQRSGFEISEAIRKFADIEDNRYKFY